MINAGLLLLTTRMTIQTKFLCESKWMKAYGMARKQWQTELYRITQKCPEPAVLEEKEISSNKYMVTW